MGKDFYENSALAKEIFDKGSEILNLDLKELCFEENDRLDKTEYTQAAMVTACLAMTREVEARGLHADMTAGLSLGEYCAIAVAGGMSDMDAIRTVRARGIYMENAAPAGSGAMAAVLGNGSLCDRGYHQRYRPAYPSPTITARDRSLSPERQKGYRRLRRR